MSLEFGTQSESVTSLCADRKGGSLRKRGFSFIFIIQVLKFPPLVYLWDVKKTFSQRTASCDCFLLLVSSVKPDECVLTQGLVLLFS